MTDFAANPAPPGPPHDTPTETHAESRHVAADEHTGPVHAAADHGGDHGHDDHAHGAGTLGPIDAWAWGAGALGVGVALVTALCFAWSTGAI
jgi:hypothetical protein